MRRISGAVSTATTCSPDRMVGPWGRALVGHGTDDAEEFTAATEENQVRYIEKWTNHGIPIDVWWIDAGWYPCYNAKDQQRRWWETGTWVPDPARFPMG